MANKKIKKTAAKKTVAKKAVAKKTTAVRKAPVAPVMQEHECHCGGHCHCCGNRFMGCLVKLVVLCIVFLLGCIASPWVMGRMHKPMMPRVQFNENGCVVLESVKCPKMLEVLATADDNADGCISKVEFKTAMKEMHKDHFMPKHPAPVEGPMAE